MKKILEHRLMKHLKDLGYETVERRAIELYVVSLERYMVAYLKSINSVSKHALKSQATLLDVLRFVGDKKFEFSVAEETVYEYEKAEEEVKFDSPLVSNIEKYIHIYEFMPNFPPAHAFRQTIIKPSSKSSRSLSVKNRLEQSLRSENNLLKLIKASGSLPPFINFLYRTSG